MNTTTEALTSVLPDAPATGDNATLAKFWHGLAGRLAEGAVEAAARAGRALRDQRELCKASGESFSAWCSRSLSFSRKTAYQYIHTAERWEDAVTRGLQPTSVRQLLGLSDRPEPPVPNEDQQLSGLTRDNAWFLPDLGLNTYLFSKPGGFARVVPAHGFDDQYFYVIQLTGGVNLEFTRRPVGGRFAHHFLAPEFLVADVDVQRVDGISWHINEGFFVTFEEQIEALFGRGGVE